MESNSARSFRCIKSIQNRSGIKAKVILLVGRLGAGKSSLTEVITGAEGLSSGGIHSSTDHCQIFDANINGEEYFIVDTPGFEPYNKGEIFRQITGMLQQLHQNSIFGIWYLINNLTRQDGFDQEMVAWLIAFCGQSFCPNVTIVTTFWTGEGGMLRNQNQNLQQRLDEEWAQLQACGARHHAFGKYYVNGIPQESTISLFDPAGKEELKQQAGSMVTRYCHSESTPYPQILRELCEPRPLHRTSAGRVFPPQNQQAPRSASPEEREAPREASDAEPRVPRQERAEASVWSLFPEVLGHALGKLLDVAVADATDHLRRRPIDPIRGGIGGIPPTRALHESGIFQQSALERGMQESDLGPLSSNHTARHYNGPRDFNFDPLSSCDTAKLYNRPGDFNSREEYYNSWGLNARYGEFKGTAEQNDTLREEMHKRWHK
ncbi:uncharacterized protein BDW43DRAFT_302834 [Aspergillus alliaceus]|uniref:uncharacterized protein n=1 Tax=Petromyces alliaceus TaxID=209559 RepID=UPI0012A65A86|nr:uncharacterized protein BDW43DRAFT_302834 [Aspergillus alliaceus]KAB8229888.1 hypothetical protein BDW43DRAFT_302834 [Aspergillus alliaceus]